MVQRTREYEQGLVVVYQKYLQVLDEELRAKGELADVALTAMCTLLTEATHFNFRVNIMSSVVSRLSKRTWDENLEQCLQCLITVFKNDLTGTASLELVRLLNRMIKERKFRVHPNVLSCLLHLRLRNELGGVRASETQATRDEQKKKHLFKNKKGKRGKDAPPHLSKKAKKTMKEMAEIEKEMQEAEAEVDKEDRAIQQTETLKLLFVLYFRILKGPASSPLLPAALEGISRYAYFVNIDFFKDLLAVLREHVTSSKEPLVADEENEQEVDMHKEPVLQDAIQLRHRLLCIATAFELLTGQGEALTIDLHDFVNELYVIILELAVSQDIESAPRTHMSTESTSHAFSTKQGSRTTADLLFRTLTLVFRPKAASTGHMPSWRSAAFAKRLMISSVSWPPATSLRALEFVEMLVVKDPRVGTLLSTDDRTADGVYRPELDDPQLCNAFGSSFWELRMLETRHYDASVRDQATKLANYRKS